MGRSYGTITITDNTDLGQLSVYLVGSTVRQQAYDVNNNVYFPNWNIETNGTALVITPHVFYNGSAVSLTDNKLSITWSKVENGISYGTPESTIKNFPVSPVTSECPESLGGTGQKELSRPKNLGINSTGVIYTANISYQPITGDSNTVIHGVATLDFTISKYGRDGEEGPAAKQLQLTGTSSHFTYRSNGDLYGASAITLTAQKNSSVAGIHWYYTDDLGAEKIITNALVNNGDNNSYTSESITIDGTKGTFFSILESRGQISFKVVETTGGSSATEVPNGIIDYFTIFRYEEAQPGDNVYASYLDNDTESVSEFNGVLDLTTAISTFYINKGGVSDISNWEIAITSSTGVTYQQERAPGGYNNTNNKITVTGLTANTAWIQFTATHKNANTPNTEEYGLAPLIQRFTVSKNPSLVSHSLRLDSAVANRDANGKYTPSKIEIDALTRTGGGTSPYRNAGVISALIHYLNDEDDSHVITMTNAANSALSITLADSAEYGPVSYIEVFLGASPNYDDKQKIVVSSDGINGVNGINGVDSWSANLTNSFDAISTTYDFKVTENFVIKIPFEVMKGITKQQVYYYSGSGDNYPRVTASLFNYTDGSTLAAQYYLGNVQKSTGNIVDNVRFTLPSNVNKSIGENGVITLSFALDAWHTITKDYHYKSIPEALDAIRVQLYADPSDTFENQSGERIVRPTITSGVTDLTSTDAIIKYTWYIFDKTWKKIAINSTSEADSIYIAGIVTGQENNSTWINATNGTSTSKLLKVAGNAVNGYASFKLEVTVAAGGVTKDYIEYITLKDVSDPIQVSVLSTVGEHIVNGQGAGAIYARVTRNNYEIDEIVSDGLLAVGTDAPTQNINTGVFQGKLGYVYLNSSTGAINYYSRTSTSTNWELRTKTEAIYSWSFRDQNNTPIIANSYEGWENLNKHLKYIIENDVNTQFIYIDKNVIKNKLIADVQVTL